MLSKYLRRPEELEAISACQFAKMYTTSGLRIKQTDEEENDEEEDDMTENESIMDYIVTDSSNYKKLPKYIQLQRTAPREPKIMRKRKKPAVLRYHKSNKDNQFEKWMLKELMLYTPFRQEDLDDYENNTAAVYALKQTSIMAVKQKVMEHLESVEEARLMVEESTKEVDLERIGIDVNAAFEQDQADCQQEGMIEHPNYMHLDTDGIDDMDGKKHAGSVFKEILVPTVKELREDTQKLDRYQKEVLNIAITFAKDMVKSRREGNLPPTPIYLMVHGGAGTEKSTVINLVSKWCHVTLSKAGDDPQSPYILKTAFTGTAASNIDGQTLHTSFSFTFDNKHYSLSDRNRDEKRELFKNLTILIIDEVSMVKSDMLYQMDLKLQELKERPGVPFGGVAVLLFGDMLQLRPVLGAFPFEKPKNPDFQATFALQNRWEMFKVLNLEVNHRQGNDKDYADMLNRIRI